MNRYSSSDLSKQKSKQINLIITIIIALLAIAAVIFVAVIMGGDKNSPSEDGNLAPSSTINLSDDQEQEMYATARRLIRNNYEVFSLLFTMQYDFEKSENHFLPEPYGNLPEDGYYTLKAGIIEYENVDEIFSLIKSTYTSEAANSLINTSELTDDKRAVYIDRDGKIGVNMTFHPMEYNLTGEDISIKLEFLSENETAIIIEPNSDNTVNKSDSNKQVITKRVMMKKQTGDTWLLEGVFWF